MNACFQRLIKLCARRWPLGLLCASLTSLPLPAFAQDAEAGQLAARTSEGKKVYSFRAQDLDLKLALATFARANELNIVPDADVSGQVTLDVRDLPLEQMMQALLEAHDFTWSESRGLIRVRAHETRTFVLDYVRLSRKGTGQNAATLGSSSGGSGGGSGGGGGYGGGGGGGGFGGGGGGGNGGSGGGSGGSGGSSFSVGSSSVFVTADNSIDFWKELREELGYILTPAGKASLSINMTAGIVQVTDRPSALRRAEQYLNGVDEVIHRQIDIEANIYDVTLNDQFQFGIDWAHVASAYGGLLGYGASTLPAAIAGATLKDSALSGLNTRVGGRDTVLNNPVTLVFSNYNTAAAINALKEQGNVEVISKPRIRTLNNQTALIKVGTETPFFSLTTETLQSQSGNQTTQGDEITQVTVGTILTITPQISADNWISLDISPVLTSLVAVEKSPSGTATAPVLDTKQASTLIRVRDGTTIILGGLIQNQRGRNQRKVPLLGDIPILGRVFTGKFDLKVKKELVIFITPKVVREDELSVPQVSVLATPEPKPKGRTTPQPSLDVQERQ